jgi:hypothetical protein
VIFLSNEWAFQPCQSRQNPSYPSDNLLLDQKSYFEHSVAPVFLMTDELLKVIFFVL